MRASAPPEPPIRTLRRLQSVYPQHIPASTPSGRLMKLIRQPPLPKLISLPSRQTALRLILGAAALVLALAAIGPAAAAAKPCGLKVIDDWYDNGRVDGSYPLHCYDDAIDELPRDVLDYGSAKEDITRALQARMNGQAPPPSAGDPTPSDPGARPRCRARSRDGDGRGRRHGRPEQERRRRRRARGRRERRRHGLRRLRPGAAARARRACAAAPRGRLGRVSHPPPAGAPAAAVRLLAHRPTTTGSRRWSGIILLSFFRNLQDFLCAQAGVSVRRSL